ncbi:OmpW/AlkL family protein [Sulfuriferula thiophila]|uniref:OmpW/AlkL family protein n=1 Tax=Sulfuriferula thiophila TaxID=1781211 RepID=UPI001CB8C85D|nr:OmpW family outer membrane protein [Sulfuriferula thiophila]
MIRKNTIIVLGILASTVASADQGDWLVRARAISVQPQESSSLGLSVDNALVPEVDFSYFVTKNVALELILGTSRHEVSLGSSSLGKVSVLPPTLTAQYHFAPDATVRPYVGAGVNYTRFYSNDLKVGTQNVELDNNSWGGALQAGVDIAVGKNSFINLDIKKIYIKTDVALAGTKIDTLKLDPLVLGVGYGMKF